MGYECHSQESKVEKNADFYKGEGILHYENMINMRQKIRATWEKYMASNLKSLIDASIPQDLSEHSIQDTANGMHHPDWDIEFYKDWHNMNADYQLD